MLRAAVLHKLSSQPLDHSIEHGKRPAPFEDPLRCLIVRRLAFIALFTERRFQRHNRPAAAFTSALAVSFVSHKEFQGSQKKGSESALFWVGAIKISPFEHADEEILRQILGLIGRATASAEIRIQRIPIVLTKRNQGGPGLLSMWVAGSDHEGPARRRKLVWPRQGVHGLAVRHGLILAAIPLNRIRDPQREVTAAL